MNRNFTAVSIWYRYVLTFFLFTFSLSVFAQQTIRGRITDQTSSNALSGINVVVKGTTRGAITDANGNFQITASPGEVLEISAVNYEKQQIKIGNSSTISVGLVTSNSQLNEVVVIGYGERRRKDVVGAISAVGAKDIQKSTALSPEIALKGQVAGVRVTNGGDPTSRPTVQIRGVSTFGYQDPLYVIDGIPIVEGAGGNWKGSSDPGNNGTYRTPVNIYTFVNANDIETMTVLKDASASAIYGVRAANGVILITTKKGKAGRARIDVDASYITQKVPKRWDVLNTQQFVKFYTDAYNANPTVSGGNPVAIGAGSPSSTAYGPFWDPASPQYLGNSPTYDWQDAVINKNSAIKIYNARVSGGTENTRYKFTAGYQNSDGLFIAKNAERYNVASDVSSKLNKYIEAGMNIALVQEKIRDNTSNLGVFDRRPWQPIYDPLGYRGYASSSAVTGSPVATSGLGLPVMPNSGFIPTYGLNTKPNPLGSAASNETRYVTQTVLGTGYVQVEPITGLKIKASLNGQRYVITNTGFSHFDSWRFSQTPGNPYSQVAVPVPGTTPNYFSIGEVTTTNILKDLLVNYNKSIGLHNFFVTLDASQQNYNAVQISQQFTVNTLDPAQRYIDGTQQRQAIYNSIGKYSLIGYMGRLSYNYNSKYYIEGVVRRDGSSRFAPENRWGTFASGAVAWRISQEKFMSSISFINDLKLRAGYGVLGNQETTGGWAYLSNPNVNPHYSLGNAASGFGPIQAGVAYTSFPNYDLEWERKYTTNIGFDAVLFKNLNVTFEYYKNVTKGIIQSVSLSPSAGFQSNTDINIASVLNRGLELTVGYNRNVGKVNLYANANFSTVHNEVLSLYQNQADRGAGREVGLPLNFLYGYQLGGIFQTQADIDKWKLTNKDAVGTNKQAPGDMYFQDLFGPAVSGTTDKNPTKDGTINDQDRTYLGNTIPGYTYGFTLGANYANFELSAFFQGVGDVQKTDPYRNQDMGANGDNNVRTSVLNAWTAQNPSNTWARAVRGDPNSNRRFADYMIMNGDYLRLQSLELTYRVPKNILDYTKVFQGLNLTLGGLNLFTITKYTGLDPENDNTPNPRQLMVRLTAAF